MKKKFRPLPLPARARAKQKLKRHPPSGTSHAQQMVYTYTKNDNGHFVCPHCGVTEENQNTMHYHLKRHDNNFNCVCKHCEYKCQSQSALKVHIAAKHPQTEEAKGTPVLKCPCNGCTFQTLTRGNRIIHFVRKHCSQEANALMNPGPNGIECRSCKKNFASSTSFLYHATNCIQVKEPARLRLLQGILTATAN